MVKLIKNCNRRVPEACEGPCPCKYEPEKPDKPEKPEKPESQKNRKSQKDPKNLTGQNIQKNPIDQIIQTAQDVSTAGVNHINQGDTDQKDTDMLTTKSNDIMSLKVITYPMFILNN